MKSIIQLVLVALVMGGLSAAGSYFWKQKVSASVVPAPEAVAGATEEGKAGESAHEGDPPQGDPSHVDAGKTEATPKSTASHETAHPTEPEHPVEPAHSATPIPEAVIETPASSELPYVPPVAARPPYVADGDQGGQLITALRARSQSLAAAEQHFAERQAALNLIFEDLRSEQKAASKIRQRIFEELGESSRLVDESLKTRVADDAALQAARIEQENLKKQLDALRESAAVQEGQLESLRKSTAEQEELRKKAESQRAAGSKGNDESGASDTSGSPEENANLKKLAAIYDSMAPENTAKVVQELVKKSKTAAVVSLLNAMKERQASKVLALIAEENSVLAADLTERLKRHKKDPAPQGPQQTD